MLLWNRGPDLCSSHMGCDLSNSLLYVCAKPNATVSLIEVHLNMTIHLFMLVYKLLWFRSVCDNLYNLIAMFNVWD